MSREIPVPPFQFSISSEGRQADILFIFEGLCNSHAQKLKSPRTGGFVISQAGLSNNGTELVAIDQQATFIRCVA